MQKDFLRRAWVHIELDRLADNVASVRSLIGNRKLMAVIKANAYGHGDEVIARELQSLGVNWFAVSNVEEAVRLRKFGVRGEILILGSTPADRVGALLYYNLLQTVVSAAYGAELAAAALAQGGEVRVHLAVDTGMGRIGLVAGTGAAHAAAKLGETDGLCVEGLFTHFASADSDTPDDMAYTERQQRALEAVATGLPHHDKLLLHGMNSAGALYHQDYRSDIVRAGIILYGMRPNAALPSPIRLAPVMEMKAAVVTVKEVPAGTNIGYGRTYVCERPMKIATVAAGYADGYPRLLSNKASVLLHGKRCPLVGRVCMDQLMVDCTGVEVRAGDIATLFGSDGEECITLDELAELCGTISYELTCGLSMRVPRVYRKCGEIVRVVEYM